MKDNMALIGLDFETSAGDTKILAPIQIGITYQDQDYEAIIGNWKFDDSQAVRWSEGAAKIHNIPRDVCEGLDPAQKLFNVDVYSSAWLLPLVESTPRMNRVLVGWNVGSFDRRIVADWFPVLNQVLSYRTLDLNTVCYFTADLLNGSYEAIKKTVKAKAAEALGEEKWHDALFDAKAGLLTYQYLLEMADLDVSKLIKDSK